MYQIKYSSTYVKLDKIVIFDTAYIGVQDDAQRRLVLVMTSGAKHYIDFLNSTELEEAYKGLEDEILN